MRRCLALQALACGSLRRLPPTSSLPTTVIEPGCQQQWLRLLQRQAGSKQRFQQRSEPASAVHDGKALTQLLQRVLHHSSHTEQHCQHRRTSIGTTLQIPGHALQWQSQRPAYLRTQPVLGLSHAFGTRGFADSVDPRSQALGEGQDDQAISERVGQPFAVLIHDSRLQPESETVGNFTRPKPLVDYEKQPTEQPGLQQSHAATPASGQQSQPAASEAAQATAGSPKVLHNSIRKVLEDLGLDPTRPHFRRILRMKKGVETAPAAVQVLREQGLTPDQVRQAVWRNPNILRLSPDTLRRRICLLADTELCEVRDIIAGKPLVLSYKLEEHLAPALHYFRHHLGMDTTTLRHLMFSSPHMFGSTLDTLQRKADLWCQLVDVDAKGLTQLLVKYPSLLSPAQASMQHKFAELRAIGLDVAVIKDMVKAVPPVLCIGKPGRAVANRDFLVRELGVQAEDLLPCFQVTPVLLVKNLDSPLYHLKIRFLREVIRIDDWRRQLLMRPAYLGYSLLGRIGPRTAFLQHNALPLTNLQYIAFTNAAFVAWLGKQGGFTPAEYHEFAANWTATEGHKWTAPPDAVRRRGYHGLGVAPATTP